MTATLEELVKLRSQLAEGAVAYFTQLAGLLDQTYWTRRTSDGERVSIKASEIAVEPFVLTQQGHPGPPRMGREDDVRGGVGGKAFAHVMDEIEAERYELPIQVEERHEERWRLVVGRGRVRLGLKGAPGSGKTLVTRHTLASIARDSLGKLERWESRLHEVEIPIWVTAKALADAPARESSDSLLQALENTFPKLPLLPRFGSWLRQAVFWPRTFIVVDALDELLEVDRAEFQAKAEQLERLPGRLIITCRTMQWEERRSWSGWGRIVEVELAPFKRRQQREFTRKFFGDNSTFAQSMDGLLQGNFALRHACTTPLLLTFGCLLHENGSVKENTTYGQLYAEIARKLVCGEWRSSKAPKPQWVGSAVKEEKCFRFLEGIAWGLFSKAPNLNRFTLDDWEQAGDALRNEGKSAPVDSADFLGQLEQVGFVVPGGFDEQRRDRCWSFLHRTLLEFLAASALSRMQREVWLNEAKKHFWLQPEWLEVLSFLAGLVDDPKALIDALENEEKDDDLFRSMLYLKARLIGRSTKLNEQVVQKTWHEVYSFWRETLPKSSKASSFWSFYRDHGAWPDCLREFAQSMFSALAANAIGRSILTSVALELMQIEEPHVRVLAADMLLRLGDVGAEEGVVELTRDSDASVRQVVAKTLGIIADERMTDRLLQMTMTDVDRVQWAAAYALGAIGTKRALQGLLKLTWHVDSTLRTCAIAALGKSGAQEALQRFLELAGDAYGPVRYAVASAIGSRDEQSVDALLRLMRDNDRHVSQQAAHSLGSLGLEGLVETLLEWTCDENPVVRAAAATALGEIGDERALDRLFALTREEERYTRLFAARALGKINNAGKVMEQIMELTRHTDWWIRQAAAECLSKTGDRALVRLLELTNDQEGSVRAAALAGLNSINTSNQDLITRVLELTRDDEFSVRKAAAIALSCIDRERGLETLLTMTRDRNPEVAATAVQLLGNFGCERVVKRLLELRQSHLRWAASKALWQIAWRHRMPIRALV